MNPAFFLFKKVFLNQNSTEIKSKNVFIFLKEKVSAIPVTAAE